MQQISSRRLLGLGAMLGVGLVLDFLPSGSSPAQLIVADQNIFIPGILTISLSFLPYAVGAYIARTRFLPIAISFAFVAWSFGQYFLYKIALPAGPVEISSVALGNMPGLFMMLVAAVLGTVAGEWQYGRSIKIVSSAS